MTKPPSGLLACFRVYPEKKTSRLHYEVRVFRSVADIRRYLRAGDIPNRTLGRYGIALCSTYSVHRVPPRGKGRTRKQPVMGEIVFPVGRLGAGVIAHESTHAALGWAKRIGLNPVDEKTTRGGHHWASKTEERFCYGLGEINRQIAVHLFRRKLIS